MKAGRLAATSVALVILANTAASGQPPKLGVLLARLSAYLSTYEQQMSAIVADEYYRQDYVVIAPDFDRTRTRILQSDYAFLRMPGELAWLGLRDTYAVDGVSVRDRDARLEGMLSIASTDAIRQARVIAAENARYNIGDLERTINIPTLAVGLLLPQHRKRFRFSLEGEEPVAGRRLMKLNFLEHRRPSIIRSREGRDQPVRGSAWLDAATGSLHRTLLEVDTMRGRLIINTQITVDYTPEDRLGILVPRQMHERYVQPLDRTRRGFTIDATASYTNYRRFQTSGRIVNE